MFKRPSINKAFWVLFQILFLFLSARSAFPAERFIQSRQDGPVSIKSDKMTIKGKEDKITFEGHVLITKGDLKIQADRAEIFLAQKEVPSQKEAPKGPKSSDPSSSILAQRNKEVSRIETSGNVDVQQGDKRAKAQKGIYDQKKNQIVLTGDPEAWESNYRVKGKVITLFLAENRSLVEESQVVIHPKPGDLKLRKK